MKLFVLLKKDFEINEMYDVYFCKGDVGSCITAIGLTVFTK